MRGAKPSRRARPRLPKVAEEMQQWSELLLAEALQWKDVSTRPMFGMTALYRGRQIFAVLPRTRGLDTAHSIGFKLPRADEVKGELAADERIIRERRAARWISFELNSGR